eukprot:g214.t1
MRAALNIAIGTPSTPVRGDRVATDTDTRADGSAAKWSNLALSQRSPPKPAAHVAAISNALAEAVRNNKELQTRNTAAVAQSIQFEAPAKPTKQLPQPQQVVAAGIAQPQVVPPHQQQEQQPALHQQVVPPAQAVMPAAGAAVAAAAATATTAAAAAAATAAPVPFQKPASIIVPPPPAALGESFSKASAAANGATVASAAPHGLAPTMPGATLMPPAVASSSTSASSSSGRSSTCSKSQKAEEERQLALLEEGVIPMGGRWSKEEDAQLRETVEQHGPKNWKTISQIAFRGARSDVQCLHRWQKVLRPGLVKGAWTKEEDEIVYQMVVAHGVGNIKWSVIAAELPGRLGKQARERWYNHLDPNLNKGPWTDAEDKLIMDMQAQMGNRWCEIAKHLRGRSENAVKNRWNSAMRRQLNGGQSRRASSSKAKKEKKEKAKREREEAGGGDGGDGGTGKGGKQPKKKRSRSGDKGDGKGSSGAGSSKGGSKKKRKKGGAAAADGANADDTNLLDQYGMLLDTGDGSEEADSWALGPGAMVDGVADSYSWAKAEAVSLPPLFGGTVPDATGTPWASFDMPPPPAPATLSAASPPPGAMAASPLATSSSSSSSSSSSRGGARSGAPSPAQFSAMSPSDMTLLTKLATEKENSASKAKRASTPTGATAMGSSYASFQHRQQQATAAAAQQAVASFQNVLSSAGSPSKSVSSLPFHELQNSSPYVFTFGANETPVFDAKDLSQLAQDWFPVPTQQVAAPVQ